MSASVLRSVIPLLGRIVPLCRALRLPQHSYCTTVARATPSLFLQRPSWASFLRAPAPLLQPSSSFKTKSSVKRRCKDCYFVWRKKRLYVICKTHPRHKQRQG